MRTPFHDFTLDDGTRATVQYLEDGEVVNVFGTGQHLDTIKLTESERVRLEQWLADKIFFDEKAWNDNR